MVARLARNIPRAPADKHRQRGRGLATFLRLPEAVLREDDPELGSQLLWNIAKAMSGRVRFILWQLQRAQQRVHQERKGLAAEQLFPPPALDSDQRGVTL